MMLRVQLESDLCRVEQIFIPDTHTHVIVLLCAPAQWRLGTPSKTHQLQYCFIHTMCFFVQE